MEKDFDYRLPYEEPSIRRSSRSSKPINNYSDSPVLNRESKSSREKRGKYRSNGEDAKVLKQIKNTSNSNNHSNHEQESVRKSNNRIDPELKRQMMQIVTSAEEIDSENNFFADPIDLNEAPGYCDIIEFPLDLSTIR
jgi:hypothetical protein